MEQPEVFTPQAYEAVAHSMQPVYGQTRGLSNKTIVKAQQQALEVRRLEREYMPAGLRRKYELNTSISLQTGQNCFLPGNALYLTSSSCSW